MCNFCREIHHNDNTLFVTISVIGEKEIECYKFYEKCRHSKKGSKMIGTYDINNP